MLLTSLAAAGQEPPDYFASLRLPTYVELDATYVAREKGARPDTPPAFKVRQLLLRLKNGQDTHRASWPRRNLLLVEMAGGARWTIEVTMSGNVPRPRDPVPWTRVASSAGGLLETWLVRDPPQNSFKEPEDLSACGGNWASLYGGKEVVRYSATERGTRTVRTAVAELLDRVFQPEELAQMETIQRLEAGFRRQHDVNAARYALGLLLYDRRGQRSEGTPLVLQPSFEPPADLAPWRELTEIPGSLQPFVRVPGLD